MVNSEYIQDNIGKTKRLGRNQWFLIFVIIVILAVVFYSQIVNRRNIEEIATLSDIRQVTTTSVIDLSLNKEPLPLLGTVQSQSSATIHSQIAGEVIGVYKKLGDAVWSNQIIAEIENLAQRSAVIQAKAGVEVVQATLDKIKKGSRDEQISILQTTLDSSKNILDGAKISAVNALNDSFVKADDSMRNKIDIMFRNPQGDNPQVLFSVVNSQLEIDIEWQRFTIEKMLNVWIETLGALDTEGDLIKELEVAQDNLNSVRTFLDKMALAVNVLSPNSNLSEATINIWKANISASRTVINLAVATVSTVKNSLNSAQSGLEIAQLNYEQAQTGGRTEDVISAEAQLKQAEAGLQSAYASLEKTIIRAPISGTINTLNLDKGDFVAAFSPVVVIANNNKLEIISYITEVDKKSISKGAEVLIDKRWEGLVKNIAPALDSKTKKIKIEIEVNDKDITLTNGQSVSLLVERISPETTLGESVEFSIPIAAIKIGADSVSVFTVDEQNKLIAHQIILGPIIGEKIIIKEGLTAEMDIVVDARGLKEGQEVFLNN